jgi:hypothetical protein
MEERVFLFNTEGEYNQHQVYKVDNKEATRLTESGVATRIQLGEYDDYRKKAKDLTKQFKSAEKRIKGSENPANTPEVKAYELEQLKAKYKEDSLKLDSEYKEYKEKAIDGARTKSARASVTVSESDKRIAEQLANRLTLGVQMAVSDYAKEEFVRDAAEDIKRLSDEQKTALQGSIGKVLDKLSDEKHQRKLIREVKDVRNLDLLSSKVAEALPQTVNIEYNTIKIARRWK